ncbi:hypothetical protein Hanom_Chr14g01303961 [Helianthus anomalus]
MWKVGNVMIQYVLEDATSSGAYMDFANNGEMTENNIMANGGWLMLVVVVVGVRERER